MAAASRTRGSGRPEEVGTAAEAAEARGAPDLAAAARATAQALGAAGFEQVEADGTAVRARRGRVTFHLESERVAPDGAAQGAEGAVVAGAGPLLDRAALTGVERWQRMEAGDQAAGKATAGERIALIRSDFVRLVVEQWLRGAGEPEAD